MHIKKNLLATSVLTLGLLAPMVPASAVVDTNSTVSAPIAAAATTQGQGGSYSDRTFINYTAAGKTGQYHIYASGIDRSKPVGVVFQFHGDGGYEFKNPSYKLPGLNKQAKSKNMIFVSMKAPNTQNVWWNDMEKNGEYARALIQTQIMGKYSIDKNRVWMVGYSGGAQFISQEMLEEHSDLMTGGGAVMFGGGAAPYSFDRAPSAAVKKNLQLTWHTGLKDGMGNSDPGWSALASAQKGSAFYRNAGFSKVKLETPAGIDHFNYDEPAVFGRELDRWAKTAGAGDSTSSFAVKGGIASRYKALGGAARFGQPINNERAVAGGMVQSFKKSNGQITDFYWKNGIGANPVSGGIRGTFNNAGGAAGVGHPISAERAVAGGTVQSFRSSSGKIADIYWRNDSGSHVVADGIRGTFNSMGGAATVGHPISAERAVAGGIVQSFKKSNGQITDLYWKNGIGTQDVTGGIRSKLNSMGGVAKTGFPTGSEVKVSSTQVTQKFQKGTMRWLSGGRGASWIAR